MRGIGTCFARTGEELEMFSGIEVELPTRRVVEEVVVVVAEVEGFETRGPVVDPPFCIPAPTLDVDGAEGEGLICEFGDPAFAFPTGDGRPSKTLPTSNTSRIRRSCIIIHRSMFRERFPIPLSSTSM